SGRPRSIVCPPEAKMLEELCFRLRLSFVTAAWRYLYLPLRPTLSAEHILVDDVLPDRLTIQDAGEVERRLFAHPLDPLPRHTRHVRREDDIGQLEQRIWSGRWLLRKDIKTGASQLAGRERVVEGRFVDDPAARRIDQIGRRLHAVQ